MEDSMENYVRLINNTRSKEEEVSIKVRKDIIITAERKKECENQAMKIVELLIEGKLRPEIFLKCLPHINQEIYQDIIEERAIINLCGYPICGRKLPDMPKKKYHISTKANKVYDISERKNYCSNFCYNASLHIKNQIETSPLWLRSQEDIPNYELLPSSSSGSPGKIINHGIAKPVNDSNFTSVSTFAKLSLDEVGEIEIKPENKKEKFKKIVVNKGDLNEVEAMQMLTIKENDEEILNDEEEEMVDEIEEDYRIGKTVFVKKSEKNLMDEIKSYVKEITNLEGGPKDSVDVISDKKNSVMSKNASIEKMQTKNGNKNKRLEEVIAKHKEKKANIKTVKVIELDEILSRMSLNDKLSLKHVAQKKNMKEENFKELANDNKNNSLCNENKTTKELSQVSSFLTEPDKKEILKIILDSFKRWLTLDTLIYLHGEKKIKAILNENKLNEYFEKLKIKEMETTQQIKYFEICKRVKLQELAEEKFDNKVLGGKLLPLPDYKKLKEDSKELDLKVKSFYYGLLYETPDKNFPAEINKDKGKVVDEALVSPLVDNLAQNALRRKVFLNSMRKVVNQHIFNLKMDTGKVYEEIQSLIKTFKLEAKNITFKPKVWNLIALVCIKLLSFKDVCIKEHLENEFSLRYFLSIFGDHENYTEFFDYIYSIVENVEGYVEDFIVLNN